MATGKTFESTIEIAGVLSPSLQKAIKSAVDKLEDMSEETLKSVGAAEKLAVEIDAQESALKTLKKGYADYIVDNKTSSKEAKDLKKEIEKLSRELKENKKTFSDAAKQADELGEALEDAEKDAKDTGDGFTTLKATIANLAADAIKKAVEGFKEMAVEGEAALALLQARTGANAEQMEEYEGIIRKIYQDNYGESLGDVGDKLSKVIQMTDDLDNASLEKVTKSVIGLENVFDFGAVESLRAANSLMDQFGITADEAFNLIVQGAQQGLNQNDDLLDVVNEYALQFKSAGYTADEMFNMLKNGADSGVWSVDKLGDAMKEYNIRMSDGTATESLMENYKALGMTLEEAQELAKSYGIGGKAGSKAMKTTLKAILSVADENKRYQLGVEMFGTMWEDLGEDAVSALFNTEGAIQSTNNAMAEMDAAAYDTVQGKLSGLAREYKVVGSAALGTLATFATVLMNWTTITAKLGTAKGVLLKIGPALSKAIGGLSGPVGWIILAVVALVAAFVNLWKTNEEFRNKMIGIWEGLKSKFDEFGQGIVDRLNDMGFDFENFGEVVATACEWIKVIWNGFCELLGGTFQFWWQYISDYIGFVLDYITGVFDIFCGIFTGDWELVWQGIKEIFVGIWDFIVNIFKNYLNVWKYAADVILGWFGTSFDEVWGSISSFFVKIWDSIVSFFTNIWKAITDNPIVQWFAKLFESIHNSLVSRIAVAIGLMKGCWKIITTVFGIAFQWFNTKVFTPLKNIFSSVWDSFKSKAVAAWEGIKSVFLPVAEFFGSIFSAAWEKVKSVFSFGGKIFDGVKDGIVSSFKTVVNAIIGGINKVVSVPFAAVNGILNNIRGIEVVGIKPFEGLWGENPLTAPQIPLLAAGGFTDGVSIAGEDGMEAVISFDPAYRDKNVGIWEKAGQLLGVLKNEEQEEGAGLTNKAGKLLTLDDFSLGSLVDGTSVVIYYDFSGFTWSPQFNTNGGSHDDEADIMARLRAHEAEFFDWLEEFIKAREAAQYA